MIQQIYPQVNHPFDFEVNKDMHFAAAHFIPHELAGKCANVHGHTYFANVTIAGDNLDKLGFLTNFQAIKKVVHDRYDHTLMNEHPEFAHRKEHLEEGQVPPSTEAVARAIAELVQDHLDEEGNGVQCVQVFLRETPTSYVTYRPKINYETTTLYADNEVIEQHTEVFE